jgi:hypothetical protein
MDEPSGEIPQISSTLRWEDVRLPAGLTTRDLDAVIFSVLQPQWRKTAFILVRARHQYEEKAWSLDLDVVAARILALAEAGRIDHQGDLRKWRFSEVRLLESAG